MHAEGEFNKCGGDKAYASEYNVMYCNGNHTPEVLANSINITKLQYCANLADIPHDYLVSDAFTDSTGYNNTVCAANTTSSYNSSALNGNYSNFCCLVNTNLCYCCATEVQGAITVLTYGLSYNGPCYWQYGGYYNINPCATLLCNVIKLDYCITCCAVYSNRYISNSSNCFYIYCSPDNWCCVGQTNNNGDSGCTFCVLNCYCFTLVSSNCWNFYCNGICKCQVTMEYFYPICFRLIGNPGYCRVANARIQLNCLNICYAISNAKISTIPITWSSPIKTSYLNLEKTGTGSIVYNIIDSSTGCYIACNVPTNCLYNLACQVPCHTYEIIQCSDNISCIKSYAVAVGI